MDLEDRIVTATPEGVSVELVLAGAGSRGVAGVECRRGGRHERGAVLGHPAPARRDP